MEKYLRIVLWNADGLREGGSRGKQTTTVSHDQQHHQNTQQEHQTPPHRRRTSPHQNPTGVKTEPKPTRSTDSLRLPIQICQSAT